MRNRRTFHKEDVMCRMVFVNVNTGKNDKGFITEVDKDYNEFARTLCESNQKCQDVHITQVVNMENKPILSLWDDMDDA